MNHSPCSNKSQSLLKAAFSKIALLSLFLPLLLATHAKAAVITWQTPVNMDINTPGQVDKTSGTLFLAATSFTSAVTVNTVTFQPYGVDPNFTLGTANFGNDAAAPPTTYTDLVYNAEFNLSNTYSSAHPSVFSGLTDGHQYELQIWTPAWFDGNWRTAFSDQNTVGTGQSAYLEIGQNYTTAPPQYVIGLFTAVGTTQDLYQYGQFASGGGDSFISMLGSLQLRDVTPVPEPQTWALAALGASAVFFRLRRKQRNA